MKRPEDNTPTRLNAQEFPSDWPDDSDWRDYEDEADADAEEPTFKIQVELVDDPEDLDDQNFVNTGDAGQ